MAAEITSGAILATQIEPKSDSKVKDLNLPQEKSDNYTWEFAWINVIAFIYLHLTAVFCVFSLIKGDIRIPTILFQLTYGEISAFGVTAGAHRLWAHKAYKANLPLRILLMILQTITFQNHIYEWVRDHRVHHKFTDTDADPHNAKRGFFFSHIGWLMIKKHPDVKSKGALVDLSDLKQDSVVMFQKRTYFVLMPLLTFVLPTLIPIYFWNESPWASWYATIFRYTLTLNFTWLVNSAAHIWGNKPYDLSISSSENKYVSMLTTGEGWHNYHHVFPWDYKAAELGNYGKNMATGFIDFFAKMGWAYNLKTVNPKIIRQRALRTGDSTIASHQHYNEIENNIWGWDDPDLQEKERKMCIQYNTHQD